MTKKKSHTTVELSMSWLCKRCYPLSFHEFSQNQLCMGLVTQLLKTTTCYRNHSSTYCNDAVVLYSNRRIYLFSIQQTYYLVLTLYVILFIYGTKGTQNKLWWKSHQLVEFNVLVVQRISNLWNCYQKRNWYPWLEFKF